MSRQHFKHIRTFLVVSVLWLLLAKMMITAREVQDPGYEVYAHIVMGARPVLLFPQNSLVIVGSNGGTMASNRLYDTFVFDLVKTSSTSVLLKNMQQLTTRWPKLANRSYVNMFAVGEFLVFFEAYNVNLLDLKSDTIIKMYLEQDDIDALGKCRLLSSSAAPTFYYINPENRSLFAKVAFNSDDLVGATNINSPVIRAFCKTGTDDQPQITMFNGTCVNDPFDLYINAGYVDGTEFVLLGLDNTVFRISKATFDSADGCSVPLQRITPLQFWHYQKPTPPPTNATVSNLTTASPRIDSMIWICLFLLISIFIVGGFLAYQKLFRKSPQRIHSFDLHDKTTSYASKKFRSSKKHQNSSTQKKTKKVSLDRSKGDAPAHAISSSTSASLIIEAGLKIPPTDIQLPLSGQSSSAKTEAKGEPYPKSINNNMLQGKVAESKKLNNRKMTPAMKRNFSIRAQPPTDSTKRRSSGKRSSYRKQSSGKTNHSKRTSMRSLK